MSDLPTPDHVAPLLQAPMMFYSYLNKHLTDFYHIPSCPTQNTENSKRPRNAHGLHHAVETRPLKHLSFHYKLSLSADRPLELGRWPARPRVSEDGLGGRRQVGPSLDNEMGTGTRRQADRAGTGDGGTTGAVGWRAVLAAAAAG